MTQATEIVEAVTDQTEQFLDLVLGVWNTSFLGTSVGFGILAALAILMGLMVRGAMARWVISLIMRMTRKTKTTIDDAIAEALAEPLKLVPVIIGVFIALNILGLDGPASAGERIVQSMIAVALFWVLHNAVTPIVGSMNALQNALTPVMVDWMMKFFRILFVVIGAAAVLEVWDIPVGPIIAGMGLLGVAVGLGAQDLFKNLIAGLLILAEKRFLPGEWIKVDDVVEGTVERINFRSTLVRRFDKGPVYVPNSKLADNAVTNFSRMTHRRIAWYIGVEYKTTSEQLREIRDRVLNYIHNNDDFAQPPEVTTFMRVDSFGPSSIDFRLYCFTKTTNWTDWLEIKEQLAFEIKAIVEGAGTSFAFPSQTLYIDDGSEAFMPPSSKKPVSKARQTAQSADPRGEDGDG